jgi:hypothetical protein
VSEFILKSANLRVSTSRILKNLSVFYENYYRTYKPTILNVWGCSVLDYGSCTYFFNVAESSCRMCHNEDQSLYRKQFITASLQFFMSLGPCILEWKCIMTNLMHKFFYLFYLSIYFDLTCFGISFSPSSGAGVQIRQWLKSLLCMVSTPEHWHHTQETWTTAEVVRLPLKMG